MLDLADAYEDPVDGRVAWLTCQQPMNRLEVRGDERARQQRRLAVFRLSEEPAKALLDRLAAEAIAQTLLGGLFRGLRHRLILGRGDLDERGVVDDRGQHAAEW